MNIVMIYWEVDNCSGSTIASRDTVKAQIKSLEKAGYKITEVI